MHQLRCREGDTMFSKKARIVLGVSAFLAVLFFGTRYACRRVRASWGRKLCSFMEGDFVSVLVFCFLVPVVLMYFVYVGASSTAAAGWGNTRGPSPEVETARTLLRGEGVTVEEYLELQPALTCGGGGCGLDALGVHRELVAHGIKSSDLARLASPLKVEVVLR